jgi:hypothetical protein
LPMMNQPNTTIAASEGRAPDAGGHRREKAGGHYAAGLLLRLPALVRFRRDSLTQV